MRGKRGERGLDRLRVPDVREKSRKDGKARGRRWYGYSGLRHHGKQRCGFQGYCFAARIGAADDELAGFGGEL